MFYHHKQTVELISSPPERERTNSNKDVTGIGTASNIHQIAIHKEEHKIA